jgi:hypothetical protein
MSKPTDLVQGALDLLILKILALEPMHSWAIANRIRQMSREVLSLRRAGRQHLEREAANWQRLSADIALIVEAV